METSSRVLFNPLNLFDNTDMLNERHERYNECPSDSEAYYFITQTSMILGFASRYVACKDEILPAAFFYYYCCFAIN